MNDKCEDCGGKEFTVYNSERGVLACTGCGQFLPLPTRRITIKSIIDKMLNTGKEINTVGFIKELREEV